MRGYGDDVARLHRLGWQTKDIATHLGIAERTVQRWTLRLGLRDAQPAKGQRFVAQLREQAERMFADGASRREVGDTLGITWQTIERHLPGTAWDRQQCASLGYAVRKANEQMRRTRL